MQICHVLCHWLRVTIVRVIMIYDPDVWMTSSHGITQLHPLPTFAACKGQSCITAVLQQPSAGTRLHNAESTALREIIKKEEL